MHDVPALFVWRCRPLTLLSACQVSCLVGTLQAVATEGPLVMPEKKQVALPKYCESVYHSVRRPTRTINVRLCFACSLHLPQPHGLPVEVRL